LLIAQSQIRERRGEDSSVTAVTVSLETLTAVATAVTAAALEASVAIASAAAQTQHGVAMLFRHPEQKPTGWHPADLCTGLLATRLDHPRQRIPLFKNILMGF